MTPSGWTLTRARHWGLRTALLGGLLVVIATRPEGSAATGVVSVLTEIVACVVIVARVISMPHCPRRIWWNVGLGAALVTCGDLVFAYQSYGSAPPAFPGLADAFFLASYFPQTAAVVLLLLARHPRRDGGSVLDAAILTLPIVVVTVVYAIVPLLEGQQRLDLGAVITVAYPLLDLVVLAALVRVAVGGGHRNRSLLLLTGAVLTSLLADLMYHVLEANGLADDPSWLTAIFTGGILLTTAAALSTDAPRVSLPEGDSSRPMSPTRGIALAMATLSLPVLTAVGVGTGLSDDARTFAVATIAIIMLVLLRTFTIMRLVAAQQHDLDRLARTDELTQLPNRRSWDYQMARMQERVDLLGRPITIAMLDLDRFKSYNDTFGHAAGDDLLRAAARAWSDAIPSGVYLARYGGEEFAVLLPDTGLDEAETVLDVVRRATPAPVTVSIGCAQSEPGESLATTLSHADAALYAAKSRGRDMVLGITYRASEPVRETSISAPAPGALVSPGDTP